jgi:hypothetical protein
MNINYSNQLCAQIVLGHLLWTFGGPHMPYMGLVRLWAWGGVDTSS